MADTVKRWPTEVKDQDAISSARGLRNIPWCEQYERMISGMLYDPFVAELANARFKAKAWCHRYNNFFPSPESKFDHDELQKTRLSWLREIMGSVKGNNSMIEPPFYVDYGSNVSIGDRFYSNYNLTILDCGLVHIGDRVMCGPHVSIFGGTHEVEVQSRRDNVEYAKPVSIGDDCWIGGQVVILPGVTIGQGCTIGAGSVVVRDIPAWSVAVGSPARVVRKITA